MAFYKGVYHEYVNTPAFSKPDMAVLFNSGRTQEAIESWAPTTQYLIESGITTVCTTFTALEAAEEVAELERFGTKLAVWPEENKWRGLVPWPEFFEGPEHSAWYQNQYWYVFQGKKS